MERTTPRRRRSRKKFDILSIVALGGLFALILAVHFYQPLDHDYFYIAGVVLLFLPFGFQIYLKHRTKQVGGNESLNQVCKLLFFAPFLVAGIAAINGGLDHSLPEQRSSVITRKWISRGRHVNTYVIECSSWRGRAKEKLDIDRQTFAMLRPGEPINIEVHRGLLGIPWLGGVWAAEAVHSSR